MSESLKSNDSAGSFGNKFTDGVLGILDHLGECFPAYLVGIFVVMLVASLVATKAEYESNMERHLTNAPHVGHAFLATLGTPATGALVCWRGLAVIYCDAVAVSTPVTLACTDTCHFAVP